MAKFSVVIPAFDVGAYVSKALASVSAQTFDDWECFCVNDGSRDETGMVVDGWVRRDGRIRAIHQRNSGVSQARNRALGMVCGEWLTFLDGDDFVHKSWLAWFNSVIEGTPGLDLVTCKRSQGTTPEVSDTGGGMCAKGDASLGLKSALAMYNFADCAYRWEIGARFRFAPYSRSEDYLYMTRWLCAIHGYVLTDKCLYGYRTRPGSATTSKMTTVKARDDFLSWKGIYGLYGETTRSIEPRLLRNAEKMLAASQIVLIGRGFADGSGRQSYYAWWRRELFSVAWQSRRASVGFRALATLYWCLPAWWLGWGLTQGLLFPKRFLRTLLGK